MKTKRTALILAALFIAAVPAAAFADIGTVIPNSVFVREAPGKTSRIVGSLFKGEVVEFSSIPENPNWVKVKGKGKEGVVFRKTLATRKVEKAAAAVPAKAVAVASVAPSAQEEKKSRVFEIVPEATPEELRLQEENNKLVGRVKSLEAEIEPLKGEVVKLRQEVQAKQTEIDRAQQEVNQKQAEVTKAHDELAKIHAMFPYLAVIETVEKKGEDVVLTGIGNARMVKEGEKVIIRLENSTIAKGDRVMQRVSKERYETGSADSTRAYYVLNVAALKASR